MLRGVDVDDRGLIEAGGVRWCVRRWAGVGRPVLALHGFTGRGADFAPLARRIPRPWLAPDLPGHGGTVAPPDDAAHAMEAVVHGLAALLDALGAPMVDVLGYSLGGRTALHLALAHPRRVGRMILVGATAGMCDAETRVARRAADAALAARICAEGVPAFLAWWRDTPLIRSQAGIEASARAEMAAGRRAHTAIGLARALRGMGVGAMPAVWDRLCAVTHPILLVTGAADARYGALADRLADGLPDARHVVLSEAGHCAHLERPDAFAEAARAHLAISAQD